jgi:hypothetical protein
MRWLRDAFAEADRKSIELTKGLLRNNVYNSADSSHAA